MAVLPVGISAEEGGYQIDRSLRFNSADSAYLSRTFSTPTNNTTWTYSLWVKLSKLGTGSGNGASVLSASAGTEIFFNPSNQLSFYVNGPGAVATSTSVYRDVSAWGHLVIVSNGTTVKAYWNAVEVLSYTGTLSAINSAVSHNIGRYPGGGDDFNGYMTEVNFIDGQALDPTSFGEYNSETGVWQPKAYTGSYGTNGFYLNFSDNSNNTAATLGKDYSGNGNNWTPNNFSVTTDSDSMVDTPTPYGTDTGVGAEVRGNYATWNPLDKDDGISSVTEGNLKVVTNGSNGSIKSTIAFPSGKWYWEVTSDSISGSGTQAIGIMPQSQPPTNNMSDSGKLGYAIDASFSDRKFENGTATSYGSYTQANGAVYMLAFDQDAGKLWYGVNGTWLASGDPAAGTNPSSSSISTSTAYCAAVSDNTVSGTFTVNFGNRAFAYTAPSGFKALCTQNLPEPTVVDGADYFNAVLYTGNAATNTITTGFAPDLVWIKDRVFASGADHFLFDKLRTTYSLSSNTTGAETQKNNDGFTSLDSTGFTLNGNGGGDNINRNASSFVAWNWKAGGTGVTNTAGTITSTVSANTTAGFSIVTYTGNGTDGASVGHGLVDKAPSMIIIKNRTDSTSAFWCVYHKSAYVSSTDPNVLYLNSTQAQTDDTNVWGSSPEFSSTIFKLGDYNGSNGSADNLVAYCFAPVEGYSAFGSYTGNGSSDGPFVYTGFRPRFIMVKRTDFASTWVMIDTARDPYNDFAHFLYPNTSAAEDVDAASDYTDSVSNGFKVRNTWTGFNGSGGTYIYAAFAENPFKYSLAR